MRVSRTAFCGLASLVVLLAIAATGAGQVFHRLYDGITLFVDNPEGWAKKEKGVRESAGFKPDWSSE